MTTLKEIEERYSKEGEIEAVQIADDLGLLVGAVRQLIMIIQERESSSVTRTRVDNGTLDSEVFAMFQEV